MATNTGKGSRKGSVTDRTQVENPKTDNWVKRDQDPDSPDEGQFMDNKEDEKPFKGVAKEPDLPTLTRVLPSNASLPRPYLLAACR